MMVPCLAPQPPSCKFPPYSCPHRQANVTHVSHSRWAACPQVVWAPGAEELVFVGWDHKSSNFKVPQMLGMLYCFNRPCAVYSVKAPSAPSTSEGSAEDAGEPHEDRLH
eukprot:1335272-Pyramimonas_sp.AAC.1